MKGIIRILIGVTVFVVLGLVSLPVVLLNVAERSTGIEPMATQRMLGATVQIRMYAPVPEQPDKEAVADGLGTIVQAGGASHIITHNHWGYIYDTLSRVDIWDANYQLVATLNAAAFRQLVRYSDAGTLVIGVPAGLAAIPTSLSEGLSLSTGDVVQVVHHPTGRQTEVEVIEAVVILWSKKDGLPKVILHSLDGRTIVHGDSGGGIWYNGQLVGNMWMTIHSAFNQEVTSISIMAAVPAEVESALTMQNQPATNVGDGSHLSQLLLEG